MSDALHAIALSKAESLCANVVTLADLQAFRAETDECNRYAGKPEIVAENEAFYSLVMRYVREIQRV